MLKKEIFQIWLVLFQDFKTKSAILLLMFKFSHFLDASLAHPQVVEQVKQLHHRISEVYFGKKKETNFKLHLKKLLALTAPAHPKLRRSQHEK